MCALTCVYGEFVSSQYCVEERVFWAWDMGCYRCGESFVKYLILICGFVVGDGFWCGACL